MRRHQRQSDVIRGNQTSSEAIRRHQGVIRCEHHLGEQHIREQSRAIKSNEEHQLGEQHIREQSRAIKSNEEHHLGEEHIREHGAEDRVESEREHRTTGGQREELPVEQVEQW